MRSCLNSCGDCGRAYQLPGLRRTGTRKSRAPSGGGPGQVRRLDVDEPVLVHHVAEQVRGLRPDAERAGRLLAADVEVAVLDPDLPVDLPVPPPGERHRVGPAAPPTSPA